jgi:hypothetical protein
MTAAVVDVVMAYDKNNVNPGVLGFLVVALLGVATWLLIRSMQRQLRKVHFDEGADVEKEVVPDPPEPDGPDRQR